MEKIIFFIFISFSFVNIMHIFAYLIGANLYDIWQLKYNSKVGTKIRKRVRPLVSIIIPAHNEENGIIKTLESACRSSVRKLQIIVIDDASNDNTKKLVRQFIANNPKKPVELTYLRTNKGKAVALNHALKNRVRGEFVMTLDADSEIDKYAVRRALRYFNDPNVAGVAANVRVKPRGSAIGLLQMLEHMVGYRSKKFYTITNSEFIVGGVASTYRFDVLKHVKFYDIDTQTEDIGLSMKIASLGNKAHRLIYASDVLAFTEGVPNTKALFKQRFRWKLGMIQNLIKYRRYLSSSNNKYSRSLTFYRYPMAFFSELMLLFEPLILIYVIFLTIKFMEPGFFIGAYVTINLYIAMVVMHDEHLNFRKRIATALYLPVSYFVFYLMNAVQFVAIVRCLIDPKRLTLRKNISSTWTSPERANSV